MEGGEAVREDVVSSEQWQGPPAHSLLQVSTAVRFLQNDKVAHSSEETKRNFLSKKGLTEDEIQTAFQQVGSPAVPPAPPVLYQQQLLQQQLLHQQSGFSSRLRDLLNILLLIGGVSYGVRYLWKVFLVQLLQQLTFGIWYRNTSSPGSMG